MNCKLSKPRSIVSTYSNHNEARTTFLQLDWHIDFEKKQLSGSATLDMIILKDNVTKIKLDSYNLKIHSLQVDQLEMQRDVNYTVSSPWGEEKAKKFGQMLEIKLPFVH